MACAGWVAERFKAAVLKTAEVQASVGSNPTPSAIKTPLGIVVTRFFGSVEKSTYPLAYPSFAVQGEAW
jgi:hypothetical protein